MFPLVPVVRDTRIPGCSCSLRESTPPARPVSARNFTADLMVMNVNFRLFRCSTNIYGRILRFFNDDFPVNSRGRIGRIYQARSDGRLTLDEADTVPRFESTGLLKGATPCVSRIGV
ncbi:hypothetical protein VTO42DRAFT_2557 [Malbranchea cinnamomea]